MTDPTIIITLKKYHKELFDRHFKILTDHNPLVSLQAVAPYVDISLVIFISLGSMSNC